MRRVSTPRREAWAGPSIALGVLVADELLKAWARAVQPHVTLLPRVQLEYAINTGASLGRLPGSARMLGALGVVLLAWIVQWAWCRRPPGWRWLWVAIGGGAANTIDRLLAGRVVDYMVVWPIPGVFNLADVALRGGLAVFAIMWLFDREAPGGRPVDAPAAPIPAVRAMSELSDHAPSNGVVPSSRGLHRAHTLPAGTPARDQGARMPTAAPQISPTTPDVRPQPVAGDGEHDRFAHYVRKQGLIEAYVEGTPVRALCGKVWVPTRDPSRYAVCPTCKEVRAGQRPPAV